jgi:ParB family chromosome partitioning protein
MALGNNAKKSLGRGLSSLLPDNPEVKSAEGFMYINVNDIDPNPYQPRMNIPASSVLELSESIKEKGVILPLTVVQKENSEKFILVAGERRLQASKLAGFTEVPVIVKTMTPQEMAEAALIENIHRKDLSPIEEGYAYLRLTQEFMMTVNEIATKVSKSDTYIDNKIKLTKLPKIIQNSISVGEISENHGRVLLMLDDEQAMIATLKVIIRNGLNIRRTEELVRQIRAESQHNKKSVFKSPTLEWEQKYKYVKEEISQNTGWDVNLKRNRKTGGSVMINFNNDDELINIYKKLTGKQ